MSDRKRHRRSGGRAKRNATDVHHHYAVIPRTASKGVRPAVIPRSAPAGHLDGISLLSGHLFPKCNTPRQRALAAGGALLLLTVLAWGYWTLTAPQEPDYQETRFSREFTTDNQAQQVHLTLPDGGEGIFDLLEVENFADEPLSLLPYSSRPRTPGITQEQEMTAWAQWIATSRQGIIVAPHSKWVLDPTDPDRLPAFHGNTWISVYFTKAPQTAASGIPATVLPPTFRGNFVLHYCLSQFPEDQVAIPQQHRQELLRALQREADVSDKTFMVLAPLEVSAASELEGRDPR